MSQSITFFSGVWYIKFLGLPEVRVPQVISPVADTVAQVTAPVVAIEVGPETAPPK